MSRDVVFFIASGMMLSMVPFSARANAKIECINFDNHNKNSQVFFIDGVINKKIASQIIIDYFDGHFRHHYIMRFKNKIASKTNARITKRNGISLTGKYHCVEILF